MRTVKSASSMYVPNGVSPRTMDLLGMAEGDSFHPPFYNRPPTPLPPSPSLSTLLRPPFNGPLSRPTTPESSDSEVATSISSHIAKTTPRTAPKVPTYEYYGFVLYLTSGFAFILYLLWASLPTPLLHALGVYYYPSRWWALAIPSFLLVLIAYIYVALAAYNTEFLTRPPDSLTTVTDSAAKVCDESDVMVATDAVMDVPVGRACEILYG